MPRIGVSLAVGQPPFPNRVPSCLPVIRPERLTLEILAAAVFTECIGDLSTTEDGGLAELPDSQPRSARQTVMRMIRQGRFQSAQISKASLCRQPV
jgi:hypothetical protein